MAFTTKTTIGGEAINIIQLGDKWYAKIHYQPFEKYIVVCGIKFKTVNGDKISNITIYNPYRAISDIIHEFNFLDNDGKDALSKELKENLCRSVFYSHYDCSQLPYFMDIGFSFGYH